MLLTWRWQSLMKAHQTPSEPDKDFFIDRPVAVLELGLSRLHLKFELGDGSEPEQPHQIELGLSLPLISRSLGLDLKDV